MRYWRRVAFAAPLLLALLASQVVRRGRYHGPPFTTVPVWAAPARGGDDGRALQDMLRRAVDHGTPVIVRGGVNHWRAVESALNQVLSYPRFHSGVSDSPVHPATQGGTRRLSVSSWGIALHALGCCCRRR